MAAADWSAFNGSPDDVRLAAPPGAGQAGEAGTTDPWAAFNGTPAEGAPAQQPGQAPAAGGWRSVAPRYLEPHEPGYEPDRMVNLAPADWAAFYAGQQPPPPDTRKTGAVANLAAGGNEAVAGALGGPVDLVTGAINLPIRGVNALFGTSIPTIQDPVGGSASIKRAMGLLGADPDDVAPADNSERMARAAGAGLASAVIPMGAAAAAVRTGLSSAPAAGRFLDVFGRATVPNALMGAGASVAGEQVAELAPEPYRPVVNLLAGLGAGAGLAAAGSGLNRLADYARPMNAGMRRNLLSDLPGAPGAVTPGQAQVAGQRLEGMLADPRAARTALADNAGELVPGSAPTTFQVTQDPLLGRYERGDASGAFGARADEQNAARVQAVRGIAPKGEVGSLVEQARAADPAASQPARLARAQEVATGALDAAGGVLPAGSEGQLGAGLRAPAAAAMQAAKAEEAGLRAAIDPDGTLAVDMTPVREAARRTLREMSPNAAPLAGEEGAIFQTAANLPDVQSFRDLDALKSRITTTMRAAKVDPARAQEYRRLTLLHNDVVDMMDGAVAPRATQEAAAVRAGTLAPEDAIAVRLQADIASERQAWTSARTAVAAGEPGATGRVGTPGVAGTSGGGSQAVPGASGAEVPAAGRLRDAAGNPGLPGSEPLTPTWDDAAVARYRAALSIGAQNKNRFQNAPGVGELLRSGPTSGTFRMADSEVPAAILAPGTGGANRVRAYLAAGGSEDALNTAAAYMLRREALRPDGTLDPAKYQAWVKRHGSTLSAMPDVQLRFATAARAQRAVDDAVAQHAQDTRAYQASLAGRLTGDADPVRTIGTALRSPTAVADMRRLGQLAAGNPDAQAGLQRAVADHILQTMQGDQLGAGAAETRLRGAEFQRFIRQAGPALREVMTPEQVATLQAVADDLQRSSLSVSGFRLPSGPDAAPGAAPAPRTTLLQALVQQAGGSVANLSMPATIGGGYVMAGPLGAALGGVLGAVPVAGKALANARAAGMRTVDDLVREAMLNPELARALLARVTPDTRPAVAERLSAALGRAAALPGSRDQRRTVTVPAATAGMPTNALYSPGAVPAFRENALAGVGVR